MQKSNIGATIGAPTPKQLLGP
jgi:hypothetical protein